MRDMIAGIWVEPPVRIRVSMRSAVRPALLSATWIVASILSMPAVIASVNCFRVMAGSSDTSSPAKARRVGLIFGEGDLCGLDRPGELVAFAVGDDRDHLGDALGVAGLALGVAQFAEPSRRCRAG